MEHYKHILLAVDFFEQCETVINRAKELADRYQAKLSIIHVVDSLPITDAGYGADIPFNLDLTAELMEGARKRLAELAQKLAVTTDCQWLEMGSPKTEIIRVAQENGVDLIVVGSHGRHGLALLLGSTANGVLHYAPCDVLAVRLQDN
ncbi:MAG: universal stress protein [Methylococcaceae bacterium]|nr:universal stress protein [Methylococcaceae bacterium]MDD1609801.1 universal stress protein [Methylococcaceae bacterium]MDD1616873.1 universal stress protein [Methylococcaceae bacterium]OYV16619.1 MAG: universal stress protein A [Methylococcaceae bacterium NSP1-2]